MSASAILISTVLAVLLVFALALLTGSVALLAGGRKADADGSGLLESLRLLDRQWRIERLIYRHHRLFGLLILAAGTFCVWQFTRAELYGLLRDGSSAAVMLWTLLLAQGFNLLIGLVIFLRPSLLKPVETFSNRWHHLDASRGQATPRRLMAALIALIALTVLLGSATLLMQQIAGTFA